MKQRIKVVHIVEDLKIGGLEKVIAALALGMDARKFDTQVWCLAKGGDVVDWLRAGGITVIICGMPSYHKPIDVLRLSRFMHRHKVDIVHAHGYFAGTFGRIAAILAGVKIIVFHVHSTYFYFRWRHVAIEKILSLFTDKIVCVSKAVKRFVEDVEKISPRKTVLVYNTPSRKWPCPSKHLDLIRRSKDDCVLLSVGALVENKGHGLLIEAVGELVPRFPNLRLVIAGAGPLRCELKGKIRCLGLENKAFLTGLVKDIDNAYRIANIFVMPSRFREGLGLAILEAMQCGLPVVAFRLGGICEIVENNRTGLLVPPGDVKALAQAIATLLSDKDLRAKMGREGARVIRERFRSGQMIALIESLYLQLMARRDQIHT